MNRPQDATKYVIFIDLNHVESISWDAYKGDVLRLYRGSRTVSEVLKDLRAIGFRYNQDSILNLEKGKSKSISPQVLFALCQTLEIDLSKFFPTFEATYRTANYLYDRRRSNLESAYSASQTECDANHKNLP